MGAAGFAARRETATAFLSLAIRSRSLATARRAKAIAADAETIPGWVCGPSAWEVAARSLALAGDPTIVEVGVFMGRSSVGGHIVLHNTGERIYADGHDGNYRIATSDLTRAPFRDLMQIAYTTYAAKIG